MHYNSIFLDSLERIDPSWNPFLINENLDLIRQIEQAILNQDIEYTPGAQFVLRFLSVPLDKVRVLILGQDPYPQKGVATGRAFEVGSLKSWQETFNNISLKNIIRAIYYSNKNQYLKYSEIKKEIGLYFQLKSPDQLFASWEEQGVLLLNTSFSCQLGKPNSHEKIWAPFTHKLLHFIADKKQDVVWFIWGNNAKSIINGIPVQRKIESMHPMMCYNKSGRDEDFLFGKVNCFAETQDFINWLG